MRTNHSKRYPCTGEALIEALESRVVLDGSTGGGAVPPMPTIDLSRGVDQAFLDSVWENLHLFAAMGNGTPANEAAAGEAPVEDERALELEASMPVEPVANRPIGNGRDVSWMDDGSGDGLTDDDIYDFGRPAAPPVLDAAEEGAAEDVAAPVSTVRAPEVGVASSMPVLGGVGTPLVWASVSAGPVWIGAGSSGDADESGASSAGLVLPTWLAE